MRHRHIVLLAPLTLAACVGTPPIAQPAPRPPFDVFAFFFGATTGTGRLKKVLSATESTLVHGTGRIEGDTLILDQTVKEGDKPVKHRQWRIHRDGPGHYSGTLTDASGPVTGQVQGNRLHLSFRMKGGFPTQQWLTLAPDGQSAYNVMVVKKLGLTLAVLKEEIRRTG